MKAIQILFSFFMMLLLAGCGTSPALYPRTSSHAIYTYKSTQIGKIVEKKVAQHPGKSGFDIIRYGREAFTARIAMTRMPQKSLDLQYYIWDDDATGRQLAYYTLEAADRGVKVRVLLDDIGLEGRDDMLTSMAAHPNIEIRIFNPFSNRRFHLLDFLTDTDRVNHRMHNKMVIMDNTLAIVGGRNIGNHYFGVSKESNFRDLDVAAVGPVVRDISKLYDYFWNGKWSIPISALSKKVYTLNDLKKQRKKLEKKIKKDHYPYPLEEDSKKMVRNLESMLNHFVWCKGEVLWNDPNQMRLDNKNQKHLMHNNLYRRVKKLQKSIYMEAAYFIPREIGMDALLDLRKKGVKVRLLTNSYKSNDVSAVYAGYEKYREVLLHAGVEIYELKPNVGDTDIINRVGVKGLTRSGLHAKVILFDEKDVFIGSYNLDPRSAHINTEGGLYIESPALAKRVIKYMNNGIDLAYSYRLALDKEGKIIWITEENGKEVVYRSEPNIEGFDRLKINMLQLLPLEDQL